MRPLPQTDKFEDALNENPMKVVKLSWVIVGVCCIVFGFVASGYFYWDGRLIENEKTNALKFEAMSEKINSMEKTVNVVGVKQDFMQRDLDEIKKNLQDFIASKNESKKNIGDFAESKLAQK